MKKYIAIPMVAGLILAFSLMTMKNGFNVSNEIYYPENGVYNSEIEEISTVSEISDTIIKAELLSKKPIGNDGTFEYSFSILKTIIGENEDNIIKVYQAGYELDENILGNKELLFEEGKEYYLFLESWEDEYYPSTIYTSVHEQSIVKIDNNKLLFEEELFVEIKNEKDLVKKLEVEIKRTDKELKKEQKSLVKTNAKDTKELVSLSDFIAVVKPVEILNENSFVKLVQVTVVENLKGTLTNDVNVFLPSEALVGKEYLVFGNDSDGALRITTREGSFLKKGTKEFDEIYKETKK